MATNRKIRHVITLSKEATTKLKIEKKKQKKEAPVGKKDVKKSAIVDQLIIKHL